MSLKNSELSIVNIDFENEVRTESRNSKHSSQSSLGDELLSHYSYTDSDLHDFQKLEKDIYGSHGDDESSHDHDMIPEFLEDATDEQTESLEFIRPHVPVRPFLGDPIDTYDQLQSNYQSINTINHGSDQILNQFFNKTKSNSPVHRNVMSPSHKSRGSSRASGGSAETVLSQSQIIEEIPTAKIIPDKQPKIRNKLSSISSVESGEKSARKRPTNRATLKSLLDQEKATRKSQETYIEHLQQSLNQLLSQHALAKETIDQLRLGIALNINEGENRPKLRQKRYHKRSSTTNNSQILSRRYSSIIGNTDIPDFMDNGNMSRAKSVDMDIFDEEPVNEISELHSTANEFGGSLKYVKNNHSTNNGLSSEIANDFQLNFDKFQTRVEIIEQAIEELSSYVDGGASGSSGSQYGDLEGSNDRHQADSENRLQNILLAYDNLQKDFNQVCKVWKDTAKNYMPATKVMNNMDSAEQIEASLFQLRMQLDDLERHVKQDHQSALMNQKPDTIEKLNRNQDLVKRMSGLEDQYNNLMGRYNDLQLLSSPSRQKDKDEVIKLLKTVVAEANGRSSNIATPEALESMLHQDLIESMKRHLSSDSPPYFLTEDGLSSANSSFGKGKSRRKKIPISEESTNWKLQSDHRLSPTKSRHSPRSAGSNHKYSPIDQLPKYDSQPVSLVSSTSGWQGATSGETLLVDERGILTDKYRQGSKSTNDVFLRANNHQSEIPFQKSRSFTNSVDVESNKSRPNSSGIQNIEDDVQRLDEHLARIELEEKNRLSEVNGNRDSDVAPSRNTRSLLGTSPSNSNYSRQSKPVSSIASSHRSTKSKQSKHSSNHDDFRKKSNGYRLPIDDSTDSGEESASYEEDLEDYVKTASCGIGPRSRYVRKKNNNVQDRWSQTPMRQFHKANRHSAYDMNLAPDYDGPYIDDVAYWDGVSFHPAREGLPGKSILRRSSPNSKYHRKHFRKSAVPVRPLSDSFVRPPFPIPRMLNHYPEPSSLREYSTIGPHRYFVREYGHLNRLPHNHPHMYEHFEEDDEDEEEEEDDRSYRKHIEERRLCNYLDEAIKAARDMKEYTRRLGDICETRQYGRTPMNSSLNRNSRPLYI